MLSLEEMRKVLRSGSSLGFRDRLITREEDLPTQAEIDAANAETSANADPMAKITQIDSSLQAISQNLTSAAELAQRAMQRANQANNRAMIPGEPGKDGKDGTDAAIPTDAHLTELIAPMIPAPIPGKDGINGKDGTNGRNGIDGTSPTDAHLIELINARIPAPIKGDPGKDGLNGKDGTNGTNGIDGKTPTTADIITAFPNMPSVYKGTKTETMPLIALGGAYSFTVAVTGARAGMVATVNCTTALGGGTILEAVITANDVVTIYLKAGIALAAGTRTFNVRVNA